MCVAAELMPTDSRGVNGSRCRSGLARPSDPSDFARGRETRFHTAICPLPTSRLREPRLLLDCNAVGDPLPQSAAKRGDAQVPLPFLLHVPENGEPVRHARKPRVERGRLKILPQRNVGNVDEHLLLQLRCDLLL